MTARESALNLRKSNFIFGNDPRQFESTYDDKYKEGLNVESHLQNLKTEAKKDVRKTNIKIESIVGQKDQYLSQTKMSYKNDPAQPLKLSDVIDAKIGKN